MVSSAVFRIICLSALPGLFINLSGAFAQSGPDQACNFKYENVCYPDQASAEEAMRSTSPTHGLLEMNPVQPDPGNFIHYYIKPVPALPDPAWYTSYYNPPEEPIFATYDEALAFLRERAAQPSAEDPDRIDSDDLVFRGESIVNGLIRRYFSHNYTAVPIQSIDVSETGPANDYFRRCENYSPGVNEANINRAYHFVYSTDDFIPPVVAPNIVSFAFNNCPHPDPDDDIYDRIYGFHVLQVLQIRNVLCNIPYTYDGEQCVNDLTAVIEKGPFYVVEEPPQSCPEPDLSDPCDATNGNKYEIENDYSTSADGGLSFERYYNSKGPHKTANGMGVGWRHTYSRELDEKPDKYPLPRFLAPANRSQSYVTPEFACEIGWDDIRNIVWAGDLASATATYAGGNVCEISLGGSVVAYFPIRDAKATAAYAPAPGVRTITRANGSIIQFQQSGTEWINVLNPAFRLEQSGSNWAFTDTSDTREIYGPNGKLLSITRRNGQTQTLDYDLAAAEGGDDDSSTLDRVTGPFGHTLTFTYDTDGRLDIVTTPDGAIQLGYDADNNQTTVTYPDLTARQYEYTDPDLRNHMTGLVDENGIHFASWDYDDAGRAILSELAGGKERVELAYNADGTTTVTLADGSARTYAFSTQQGQRRLSAISGDTCSTCAGGNTRDKSYDANGFVSSRVDWNDNVILTDRDERGLVTSRTDAAGSTVERTTLTEWHTDYRLPTTITAPKNTTELIYDASGNLRTRTITGGADSRTWTFDYNAAGQLASIDGPRTDVIDVTVFNHYECTVGSECGQLQSTTNALGHVTTFDSYDPSGRLLSMTDPNGLQTQFTYDTRGRVLTVTETPVSGTPRVTTMTYDGFGQLETVSMPDGLVLTYGYTDAHYLDSVSDNFGNRISYDYDVMGNRIVEDSYDPGNMLKRTMAYTYDLNERLDTITNGGFGTDLTYDAVGNLVNETNPRLAGTQHGYDALNRLDDTLDALGGVIDYGYDEHDNLTSVTAANGALTTYTYDDLDNLVSEISPDRGLLSYTYDDAGNRITQLDARGKLTTYEYDALNRLILTTFNDGQTIAYEYDTATNGIGRLLRINDSSGQTEWNYDNFGAVTEKQQTIGAVVLTTQYSYDDNGRLATMTLPSGKVVSYGYNAYQQTSVSVDGQTILSGASYDPFGPVTGWTWGDGTIHTRSYDLRGLTTSHSLASDTRVLDYNAAGSVISLTGTEQNRVFDYDLLERLTRDEPIGAETEPQFSNPPVFLASIQTMRNETGNVPGEPSSPWLTVATRKVTADSAKVSLERSQVNTGSIEQRERIGYLAIEPGGGSFADSGGNTITYEAQITPEVIRGWNNGCFETGFLNSYPGNPIVLASLHTHNAGDGGWLRRCSLNPTALGLTVDEDKFTDNERRHNNAESAGIIAFSAAFDAQFTDANGTWGMEVGAITLPGTGASPEFARIDFRQAYATRPIVIVLPSENGAAPASVRIRNVRKTGFEVVQVEPAPHDGRHASMPIHYLAIERGVHSLPDGTRLEAGQKGTVKQKHGAGVAGAEGWATTRFSDGSSTTTITQEFTYDPNGNRTSLTENNTTYPYDYLAGSNRLLSTTGPEARTYTHDLAGNITSDGIHTYDYDDRGRLTSLDSGLVTYKYNGQGQRVVKNVETQTLFLYDEIGMLIGEYDALGAPIQEHVYFNSAPVAVLDGPSDYLVHTDHLGTPRAITDNGTVIWRWDSDAFGTTEPLDDPDRDSTAFHYNLRFPGQYYDGESGLHYNYFRDYDRVTGRYVESDPIGLIGGINTFAYTGNGPLVYVDPYGLFLCKLLGLLGDYSFDADVGIGAGLGAAGGLSFSRSGISGSVSFGSGFGLGGSAGISRTVNISEIVSEGGVGTAVTVSGGYGFGGSISLNAGTGGVSANGTGGIGIGFNVTSGYHLYNRIFTCPEDSSEDKSGDNSEDISGDNSEDNCSE